MAVHKVRRDNGGSQPADNYTFPYGNENTIHDLQRGFFTHQGMRSTIRSIKFVGERISYIILRGY